jgi:hypothetical protein
VLVRQVLCPVELQSPANRSLQIFGLFFPVPIPLLVIIKYLHTISLWEFEGLIFGDFGC